MRREPQALAKGDERQQKKRGVGTGSRGRVIRGNKKPCAMAV